MKAVARADREARGARICKLIWTREREPAFKVEKGTDGRDY